MTKLNWDIGRVNENNDALYTWAISDIATAVNDTAEKTMSVFLPSTMAIVENTAQAIRSPIQTAWSGKNWMRLLKTIPVVGADVGMKALRLPFATLDNALQYVVNNNLQRTTDLTKKYTTELVGNIISDNGKSRYKALRWIGAGFEGIGDWLMTIARAPTGWLGKVTSIIDTFLAQGTTATDKWVQNLRVSEDNFIPRRHYDWITNTASTPEAANSSKHTTA